MVKPGRPGARKNKKGPTVGSGGNGRRALEGKGPTPKAKDRPYHKAHKMAARAEKERATRPKRRTTASPSGLTCVRQSSNVRTFLHATSLKCLPTPIRCYHGAADAH